MKSLGRNWKKRKKWWRLCMQSTSQRSRYYVLPTCFTSSLSMDKDSRTGSASSTCISIVFYSNLFVSLIGPALGFLFFGHWKIPPAGKQGEDIIWPSWSARDSSLRSQFLGPLCSNKQKQLELLFICWISGLVQRSPSDQTRLHHWANRSHRAAGHEVIIVWNSEVW